ISTTARRIRFSIRLFAQRGRSGVYDAPSAPTGHLDYRFRTRRLRHGVESPFVEGVAAKDPPHRQPAAPPRPVPLDRLDRVRGAGRREPARRRLQWRERTLVETDPPDQKALEHISSATRATWARS